MDRTVISVENNFDELPKNAQNLMLAIGREEWLRIVQVLKKDAQEKYDDYDCALLKHAVVAYLKYFMHLDGDRSKKVRDNAQKQGILYEAYQALIEDYDFFY